MIKKIIILIIIACSLKLQAQQTATAISKVQPMHYKMVTVNDNTWCNPKQVDEVSKEIDRIVEAGFNTISIGTFKFMPILFVDYSKTKYPEAQEYDTKKVAENVSTLRRNIQLAKSKGIKYFISRSYCHYAPYNFWKAHQSQLNPDGVFTPLLEKAHQNDIYLKTLAGKDNIIPQQQWTNPVFKDFFLNSTALMLDAIPELDGFLNAYAEAAWSYDMEKLKQNQWTNWKDIVDYKATDDNFIDYSNSLYQLLKEKRGENLFFGLRDWYVKPEVLSKLSMPREKIVISVKYAGYDQPVINYPPWGKKMLDDGYSVILDMLVYDAEHPHPLYWYDEEVVSTTFKNIYKGGFTGIMYQDFSTKGEDSPYNPIRLLTEETVGAAMNQKKFDRTDALNFLKPYYGNGADQLLTSLKNVSIAQAEMIKLCPAWFWQGDGLTPGGLQKLRYWMLMDHPEAPKGMAFIRQNVVSVKEYVTESLKGTDALAQANMKWMNEKRETPLDAMNIMLKCADEAITAACEARKKAPLNSPYMQDIVASSVIHKELVLRDIAFLKSAIAFYQSGAEYDDKFNLNKQLNVTGIDKKDVCINEILSLINHDLILRKLCLDYAPRRREMRGINDYGFEKKIAKILGKTIETPTLNSVELQKMVSIITKK